MAGPIGSEMLKKKNVSVLVQFLCKGSVESTFENVCHWSDRDLAETSDILYY